MAAVQETGLFGQPMRWYMDQAEGPFIGLALAFLVGYIGSYWLEVSYLEVVAPLVLVAQLVAAVVTAYLTGVHGGASLTQTILVCLLVGGSGGAISAILAFIRFFYPWLLLNLVTEPVWSGLIAGCLGAVTIGFFKLPKLIKREQMSNNN